LFEFNPASAGAVMAVSSITTFALIFFYTVAHWWTCGSLCRQPVQAGSHVCDATNRG